MGTRASVHRLISLFPIGAFSKRRTRAPAALVSLRSLVYICRGLFFGYTYKSCSLLFLYSIYRGIMANLNFCHRVSRLLQVLSYIEYNRSDKRQLDKSIAIVRGLTSLRKPIQSRLVIGKNIEPPIYRDAVAYISTYHTQRSAKQPLDEVLYPSGTAHNRYI